MQEMKWISAKERLPRNLDDVLVLYENGNMEVSCRYSDGWLMERKWGPVTHWMPLPEPPKEVSSHDQG